MNLNCALSVGKVRSMDLASNHRLWVLLALLGMCMPPWMVPVAGAARLDARESVSLNSWAEANGLEVRWVKRDETVQVSNKALKLVLTVDAREAQLNGVQLWLSFPVTARNGSVFLTRLDAEQTLQPLFAPPHNPHGVALKTICLDPGHGGKDPGYCFGSNQEKKYTLLLAQEVREQLKKAGFRVLLTRSNDRFRELPERPTVANRARADLFISLHFNSAEISRQSVQGAQVYCLTPPGASSTNAGGEGGGGGWFPGNRSNAKNVLLAFQLQKALTQDLNVEDHGVRRARFAVLRDATMPAVLIEAGFMSHPVEGRKIFTAAYRHQMAHAIVDGVQAYKRLVER